MSYFITGTDTDVGKTIVSSWLMLQSENACYWKPIQAGLEHQDIDRVRSITKIENSRFEPACYTLKEALSPHEAARREGKSLKLANLTLPNRSEALVVEGAGGLLVPINDTTLMIDLMMKLNIPVILVARTELGTINHTLLSLEALRSRGLEIAGVVLNGDPVPHNRQAIEEYGKISVIAEIPILKRMTSETLRAIKPQKLLKL